MHRYLAALGLDRTYFSASSVIFAGSLVVNVLNYVFTLLMGRLLSVEDFGEVAAFLSLFLVITVPATAVTMLMSREAAARSVERVESVRDFFLRLRGHVLYGAVVCWIAFLGVAPLLSSLLHLSLELFLLFSLIVPITLVSALQSGVLQGMQEFFALSKQHIFTAVVKLSAAAALVSLGLSVGGVVFALVLAVGAGWYYGHLATHDVLKIREKEAMQENISLRPLFTSILMTTLLIALLSNIDVLLAKHFFSAEIAGHYGALSTVGKILIYGVGAFVTVLLPLAAEARARGEGGEKRVLALSLAAIGFCSVSAWAVFSIFPQLVISLLFGTRYLDVAPYLGSFTIAMACVSLSLALINYFVAVRNTSFIYLLSLGVLVEFGLIVFRHNSIAEFIEMLVASSLFLVIALGLNYLFSERVRASL